MKRMFETPCHLMFLAVATISLAASAAAQTVVVGTGNPDIDVPGVQAAVDQGGEVTLKGHFSFNRPPMKGGALFPTVPQVNTMAMVLLSNAVAISGAQDDYGEMTSIQGGTVPFYVEALGSRVEIRGLRFIRSKGAAIAVTAVNGLVVGSCTIEGVDAVNHFSEAVGISTVTGLPSPAQPGHPEYVSGTLLIANNDIDVGGTAQDSTLGIQTFSVGVPGAEVEAYVSGNNIRNITEPAIVFRRVGGRAYVEGNVVSTGFVAGSSPRPEAIRVANIGSYLIAGNSIDCGWPDSQAIGIGVFSQHEAWPMERATVVGNVVTMSAPEGTVFGDFNAGIDIRGFAYGNVVLNNKIRGRAKAALSVDVFNGGIPDRNSLVLNCFDDFEPTAADIFIGNGAMNTLIVGDGSIEDHGTGTVIIPVP